MRANSRAPVEAEGDVYSLAACNDTGSERLCAMLREFGLDDLDELAEHIVGQSRAAVLERVRALPRGT